MGKDDVRKALEAMDDEDVRARLAGGDFSDVSDLDLADNERDMVQGAAADYPEVAGFAYDAFMKDAFMKPGGLDGHERKGQDRREVRHLTHLLQCRVLHPGLTRAASSQADHDRHHGPDAHWIRRRWRPGQP